jgi:hypothetical protein
MRISSENGLILEFDLMKEWDDISSFDCHNSDLKDFLQTDALKNQQSRLSVTWLGKGVNNHNPNLFRSSFLY